MIAPLRRIDRLGAEWWAVLLMVAVLAAASVASGFTARLDLLLYDRLQRAAAHPPQPQILVVAIDDRSLAEIGPWPWPRTSEARLVAALAAGRPRALALDLLLPQAGDPAGDAALARAIALGGHTYLPLQFQVPGRNGAPFEPIAPLPAFRAAAAGLGHVSLIPDADGTVRRAYLAFAGAGQTWPHLATRLAGAAAPVTPADPGGDGLTAQAPALISWVGPQGSFPTISAASVIHGEVPPEALRDKLVLVGMTASGLGDAYATPAGTDGSLMPGVEIQANLLDSMLAHRLVTPVEGRARYAFALLPMLLMMLGLRFLHPRWLLWLFGALIGAVLVGALLLLRLAALWIGPGSALLALLAVQPLWHWRRLSAVSAYIARELEQFEAERDPLERPRRELAGADFVERQIALLASAIERKRDLRRFLIDRIEQMPDAVLVVDRAGKVVIANAGARALWGSLQAGESLASADQLLGLLGTAAAPSTTGWHAEAGSADGRSFAIASEPQHAADDALIGAVIRITDTTDATLAARQREEVLQLLSHDMRSPQVSILTLLDSDRGLDGDPGESLGARIRGYAERTLRLADGFVQLSRAQSLRFEPQPVDLVDAAHEAIDALWPQASAKRVVVKGDLPDAEVLVAGDRSLLTRALINLIDNAVRFSPAGQTVRLRVAGDGEGWCAASVEDQGPGIAPEQLARLFERFSGAGAPAAGRDRRGVGSVGLGLAFVHAAVLRHGGTITCTSVPGEGARFVIRLPLCAD